MNDSANLPDDGGSKTVDSFSLSDPRALNFSELDEDDQANQDDGAADHDGEARSDDDDVDLANPDNDADEPDDGDEDDNGSDDDGDEPEEDAKLDETLVTLKGGEQVPVKELKLGYMRERDYRAKTQEVANSRRTLEAMSERVTNTVAAFSKFLANQLPPEPDRSLAVKDPAKFASQKAVYDAAMEQVQQLIGMASEPKQALQTLTDEQYKERLGKEKAALIEAFPTAFKSKEAHEQFFEETFDTARQLGFTDQELQNVVDHRYFKLAHYARLGMQAEAAKQKAMKKVENAPAAKAPAKANGKSQQTARQNQDAMKRLARTGSIKDAMAIDFE